MKSSGTTGAVLGLLCAGLVAAQTPPVPSGTTERATQKASKKDEAKKPALSDVTRVSTQRAVQSAAQEKAREDDAKAQEDKAADSSVTELRPARPDEKPSAQERDQSSVEIKAKNRTVKNIHGRVYGATDSAGTGNRTGGAVGASSSSGKTSVHVETERSRENPPRP